LLAAINKNHWTISPEYATCQLEIHPEGEARMLSLEEPLWLAIWPEALAQFKAKPREE
jgi:hypothetical protein